MVPVCSCTTFPVRRNVSDWLAYDLQTLAIDPTRGGLEGLRVKTQGVRTSIGPVAWLVAARHACRGEREKWGGGMMSIWRGR